MTAVGGFFNWTFFVYKMMAGRSSREPKPKEAPDKFFYAREDTSSLSNGIGCQTDDGAGLINPNVKKKGKMLHIDSHKLSPKPAWAGSHNRSGCSVR